LAAAGTKGIIKHWVVRAGRKKRISNKFNKREMGRHPAAAGLTVFSLLSFNLDQEDLLAAFWVWCAICVFLGFPPMFDFSVVHLFMLQLLFFSGYIDSSRSSLVLC